jgi:hypothetical protein
MIRHVVPAFLCLAALTSFSSSVRADDADVNPLVLADRLECEAQTLLGQGRCGEGARLMSKAWRLRAETWCAEVRPEPHAPLPPGGPAMPRPTRRGCEPPVAADVHHVVDARPAAQPVKAEAPPRAEPSPRVEPAPIEAEVRRLSDELLQLRAEIEALRARVDRSPR